MQKTSSLEVPVVRSRPVLSKGFDRGAFAGAWLCMIAPQGVLMMPLIIGGFARRIHLTNTGAGLLASAALTGCCLMALVQALMFRVLPQRLMAGVCIAALFSAYVLLLAEARYSIALAIMLLLGLGMGGLLVLAMTAAAHSREQFRVVAMGLIGQGSLAAGFAWIVSLFSGHQAETYLAVLLAVSALAGCAALPGMPNHAIAPRQVQSVSARSGANISILLALAAWGLINFSNGGFWPLIERVAASHAMESSAISRATSYCTLAAVVGATSSLLIGRRAGFWAPILLVGAGTIVSLLMIVTDLSIGMFSLAMVLFGVTWNLGPPYQLAIVAEADRAGNGMAWSILAMKVSMALGPVIYGVVADTHGFFAAGAVACMAAMMSTALFALALILGQRSRALP